MENEVLFWFSIAMMATSHAIAIVGFVLYGDVMQYILTPPRKLVLGLLRHRVRIGSLAIVLMVAGIALAIHSGIYNSWALAIQAAIFCGFLYAGFVMVSYHWFRTDQESKFVKISDAESDLDSKDKINVVLVHGEVRGYPTKYLLQPHFASSKIAEEEVAMTYCGLSNLGVAFSPTSEGKRLSLKTVGQLNNNVVFFDTKSGEYYQQIFGGSEDNRRKFDQQFPTRAMSWQSFKAIYPDSLVYSNPPKNLLDYLVRAMISRALTDQERSFRAHFPTIDQAAYKKLHPKQYVAGLVINDHAVAFTKKFLMDNGGTFNTELNGIPISVVLYPEFDFIDIYYRQVDGEAIEVASIDEYGALPTGKTLEHVPFFPEVHWMIWHHHYPNTKLYKSKSEGLNHRSEERSSSYSGGASRAA